MKKVIAILFALLFCLLAAFVTAGAEDEPSDVPQFTTSNAIASFIRTEMVNRKTEIRFKADDQVVAGLTLADVCAHTGVGTEGDYLRLALNYALPQIVKGADDVYVMRPVYYTTAAQEAAVGEYVTSVLASCSAEDDTAKAQYLYDYLCESVTFDLENLYNEEDLLKYTAYGAAVNGRAVCQGFATLYYRLALAAGLDCRIVTGTRGDVAHAWNIVKIDDVWYHVDASSGAQLLDSSVYFMKRIFDDYTIHYGNETAAEIQGYLFVIGNEDETLATGRISDTISWSFNQTTGELVVTGTGEMPKVQIKADAPFWRYRYNIKSAVISEGITNMPNYLFNDCTNLSTISIPSTVVSFTGLAFEHSPIESIYLGPENPVYMLRGGCVIRMADKVLICGTNNSVIPNDGSVETINDYAFKCRTGLKNITLPDGLKIIGSYAFYDCKELDDVHIPSAVTKIDAYAFLNCTGLKTLSFSEKEDGEKLTISVRAFYGCTGLTELNLPKGLYQVYDEAFAYCTGLKHLSLPTVTYLESNTFNHCGNLESITVDAANSKFRSVNNCLIRTSSKELIAGCFNSVIPDDGSVTQIRSYAFSGCEGLTSIVIPGCIKTVAGFNDCTGLTNVSFSEGITRITGFAGCTSLTEVEIPESVTYLGAFNDCNNLESIQLSEGLETLIGFNRCTKLTSICIPTTVKKIGDKATTTRAFDNCTALASVEFPDSVELISGFSNCSGLMSVIIPESVTWLFAFNKCTSLESLTIFSKDFTFSKDAYINFTCTVYGFAGSAAETFASYQTKHFIPLCPLTNAPHNTQEVGATEPDCLNPGYSAGTFCTDCEEWVTGHEQTADALGHAPGEPAPENVVAATCTAEGSYDNVTRCTRCGEALTSTPEKIAMIPHADEDHNGYCDDCGAFICEHPETSLQNAKAASCTESGYSGDTVCGWCGVTIEYGVTLQALGHSPAISTPARAATCLDPGMTAEYTCSVCGDVITAAQPTSLADHVDGNGDGLCDLCLAPTDCTQYGRCGDALFWYVENGVLVISGTGSSGDLGTVPWESCAASIDSVYLRDSVTVMDGAGFAACPKLDRVFAAAGTTVSHCETTALYYTEVNGTVTLTSPGDAPALDLPALLNAASVLCIDKNVSSLCFAQVSLCATDGGQEIVYDILKNGKIIDENHFRIPSGTTLHAFAIKPLSYTSFNRAFASLAETPDRTLILSLSCEDLLPENLKSDGQNYTEQLVLHFLDEPEQPEKPTTPETPNNPSSEKTLMERIVARFQATLAAILSVFKKLFKIFKK